MGRSADLAAGAGGIDDTGESGDALGPDRAGLYLPRRRLPGIPPRQGAGVARHGALFPSDHPAHYMPPFNVLPKPARELLCEADVILALDWMDLGGALRQGRNVGKVTAKVIAATLDQNLHTGANMEYQALPTVDVAMATTGDAVVAELTEALGAGAKKAPWKARVPGKPKGG